MSSHKLLVISLMVLTVLLAAGCQTSDEVLLTEVDNGSQVTLETGQILVVSLPSNISTGYSWEVASIDDAILSLTGEPDYVAEAEGVVGGGGMETFRFEALAAGEIQLTLIYHRPFEEGVEPIDTFSVAVEVR